MLYRQYGNKDVNLSVIGLGGHEFYDDGKIKGFADSKDSIRAGYMQSGFGEENRRDIVFAALDMGINLFDVTIDPEIEALGRILRGTNDDIYIQTRPQGMVYKYDPGNKKMAQYDEIKEEVTRILSLLKRERIEIFNFAFMREAMESDPEYMEKIGLNIARLKEEGLILFANADTFSGPDIYMEQIVSGHFDSVFINFNYKEYKRMLPVAQKAYESGMGVMCRELFMKGSLFKAGADMGNTNHEHTAQLTLKWLLNQPYITSAMVGVANPAQLESDVSVIREYKISGEDDILLDSFINYDKY